MKIFNKTYGHIIDAKTILLDIGQFCQYLHKYIAIWKHIYLEPIKFLQIDLCFYLDCLIIKGTKSMKKHRYFVTYYLIKLPCLLQLSIFLVYIHVFK